MYAAYPHIGPVLPAMGYNPEDLLGLKTTVEASEAEVVVSATPFDISRVLHLAKPVIRARYEFAETSNPKLSTIIDEFLDVFDNSSRARKEHAPS
jgi:predicted GTPase